MKTLFLSVLAVVLLFALPVCVAEIHDAAGEGDLVKIKALISENPDLVSAVNERGSTPLHSASFGGHLEVVRFLLQKGAEIDAVNGGGFTPLHLATFAGHREVVEFLLDQGANINALNEKMGATVLDLAFTRDLQGGTLEIAPFLIEKGAEFDVNKKNRFGYTTLDMAIVFGHTQAAEYLIGLGADISSLRGDGNTPLINAIKRGRPQIAKLLIEKGADHDAPDEEGNPPIRWAVEKGLSEIVALLLANHADVNFTENRDGRTLLHIAALKGYKDLVDILLVKGSEVNAEDNHGKTPLFYAGKYGHKAAADLLIGQGAKKSPGMEENYGKSPYLIDELEEGEAVAWYLAHRGWAVKTRNHMLIFDSEEFGVKRPTQPSLANGFLTPYEIGYQNVFAIYSSYHGEPGEPAYIHEIEDSVANITYIHNEGDRWRGSEKTVYMKPREEKTWDDVQIISASIPGSMPMLAYLCKLDGLVIFYSCFRPEEFEAYKGEIDFLAQHSGEVDLAILPIAEPGEEDSASIYLMEKLRPRAVFPSDPDHRVHLFPDMAKTLADRGFKTEVLCAENPGDHFVFRDSEGK